MNKRNLLCVLLLYCCSLTAQTSFTRAEYWIDNEPGWGYATALPLSGNIVQTSISTGGLSYGWHTLGLRALGGNSWSQTHTRLFYNPDPVSLQYETLTGAEYWVDNDPGMGNATALPFSANQRQFSFSLNEITTLSYGLHQVGFRVKTGTTWSATYTRCFTYLDPQSISDSITAVEWWIDNDPGFGSASSLPFSPTQRDFSFTLALPDSTNYGLHELGLRVRQGNRWSDAFSRYFFTIAPADTVTALTAVEYWIDSDPGLGEAHPLPFSPRQSQFTLDIPQLDTLPSGYHTIGLRVRRGSLWSDTYTRGFANIELPPLMTLGEVVAYWDGDTANIFQLPYTQHENYGEATNIVLSTASLSYGSHKLYLRATADSIHSVTLNYDVCKNAVPHFSLLNDPVCVGEELIILDESTEVQPETTYAWYIDNSNNPSYTTKGDIIHTFSRVGWHTITLVVQTGNGCETSYSQNIYVHTKSAPSISLSRSAGSICAGDSVVFTASPTNGGENPQYTWFRNSEQIAVTQTPRLVLYDLQHHDTISVMLTTDNICAPSQTAVSSKLVQTVYALPDITLNFSAVYYTDENAFSFTNLATPSGGTFYMNDVVTRLFNPKSNPVGTYTVKYVYSNSHGCESEAEATFVLKQRDSVLVVATTENGQMGSVSGGGEYLEGLPVTLSAQPNVGYHFVEWNDGDTNSVRTFTALENVTYTAYFAVNQYVITFVDEDGSTVLQRDTLDYGTMPSFRGTNPAKASTAQYTYSFSGWSPTIEQVSGNATYTATFASTLNKYIVTFVDEDGSTILQRDTLNYGTTPSFRGATPAKQSTAQYSYSFSGWSPSIVSVEGEATYIANYASVLNKYVVTFVDEDGSTVLQRDTLDYGTMPSFRGTNPAKQSTVQYSYSFSGWSPTIEQVSGNATYTATFASTLNRYVVTFVDEDGSTILQRDTLDYGTMPGFRGTTPAKQSTVQYSYSFSGWSPSIVSVEGEATYVANYTSTLNKYVVTFVDEDGSTILQRDTLDYGTMPSFRGTNPAKQSTAQYSYSFSGWSPTIEQVSGNATYTATFASTLNKYIVTFVDEDGSTILQRDTLNYGTTPSFRGATPAKQSTAQYSYSFSGWSPSIVSVEGEATYVANYASTLNRYVITFVDEDGSTVLQRDTLDYGAMPMYGDTIPTKEGNAQYSYAFAGWQPTLAAVTEDATYTAMYSQTLNKYVITFLDADSTLLEANEWEYGTMPTCDEPTKPADSLYIYIFDGWSPEIVPVEELATYIATYRSTGTDLPALPAGKQPIKVLEDGKMYIIMPDGTRYSTTGKKVK